MSLKDLVFANRSYRRFDENHKIELATLEKLVDLARLSAFSGNVQSVRFVLSVDKSANTDIFDTLGWAKHFKDWRGPESGERPTGYIVILNRPADFDNAWVDAGIAAQSILLGAVELGLGGCMFRNVAREKLAKALNISDEYEILMVLAIGKPVEVVQIDTLEPGGDFRYWRDESGVHHVPKRKLEELIIRGFSNE